MPNDVVSAYFVHVDYETDEITLSVSQARMSLLKPGFHTVGQYPKEVPYDAPTDSLDFSMTDALKRFVISCAIKLHAFEGFDNNTAYNKAVKRISKAGQEILFIQGTEEVFGCNRRN